MAFCAQLDLDRRQRRRTIGRQAQCCARSFLPVIVTGLLGRRSSPSATVPPISTHFTSTAICSSRSFPLGGIADDCPRMASIKRTFVGLPRNDHLARVAPRATSRSASRAQPALDALSPWRCGSRSNSRRAAAGPWSRRTREPRAMAWVSAFPRQRRNTGNQDEPDRGSDPQREKAVTASRCVRMTSAHRGRG